MERKQSDWTKHNVQLFLSAYTISNQNPRDEGGVGYLKFASISVGVTICHRRQPKLTTHTSLLCYSYMNRYFYFFVYFLSV